MASSVLVHDKLVHVLRSEKRKMLGHHDDHRHYVLGFTSRHHAELVKSRFRHPRVRRLQRGDPSNVSGDVNASLIRMGHPSHATIRDLVIDVNAVVAVHSYAGGSCVQLWPGMPVSKYHSYTISPGMA
jgi:hypothetical protein